MVRPSFIVSAISAWLIACGTDPEPPSMAAPVAPVAPEERATPSSTAAPRYVPERATAEATVVEFEHENPAPPVRTPAPTRAVAAARDEPTASAEPRDIGGELLALVQEQRCLNLGFTRFPSDGHVELEVTAFVHADGTIEKASVAATGQPLPLLRCAEVRLTNSTLRAPVPGAPNSFNGILVLSAAKSSEAQASKPYRPPENLASPSGDYTFKGPDPLDYAARTSDTSLKGARADTMAGPPD